MINIVIVEDSFDAREGFRYLLSLDSEIRVLNTYENAEALLDSAEVLSHTDVVLMDIELPGMSGIEATRIITETYRDTDILILTIFEDKEKIMKAVNAGAMGYLLKNCAPQDLVSQIKSMRKGGSPLSPFAARALLEEVYQRNDNSRAPEDYKLTKREIEVCRAIIEGKTYREMAEELHMASSTAKKHILNIYRKLQVNSRVSFIKKVIHENLIDAL